jgi:hypothetical protein
MMLLVMFIMMQFMKPLTSQEKSSRLRTTEKTGQLEEART